MAFPWRIWSFILLLLFIKAILFIKQVDSNKVNDKPLSSESDNEYHYTENGYRYYPYKEEVWEFDQLTPEEGKSRLAKMVDIIDLNEDGFVSEKELFAWNKYIKGKYDSIEENKQWFVLKPKHDALDWDTYWNKFLSKVAYEKKEQDTKAYKEWIEVYKQRWKGADKNKDNKLSKEEFRLFLNPEFSNNNLEIKLYFKNVDRNRDGKISFQEYIAGMGYTGSEEDEPDWVKVQRQQFAQYGDRNGDGFLSVEEMTLPEVDGSEVQAKYIIHEADKNKDGKLTKEEILNNYYVVARSAFTNYGVLMKDKDFLMLLKNDEFENYHDEFENYHDEL